MQYKVGDKVRIRKDLKIDTDYYAMSLDNVESVVEGMLIFCDKIATIQYSEGLGYYHIDLDGGDYYWTDGMFRGLAEETQPVNKQEEIPYINATEAREMFDVNYTADNLRMIAYRAIRECAKTQTSAGIDVRKFPPEVINLIGKELQFKGFSTYSNPTRMTISW